MSRPEDRGFDQPWQIQAFALTQTLIDAGAVSATDWTATLSRHLHAPDAAEDGSDYYQCWLAALQEVVVAAGISTPKDIASLSDAWQAAAEATPHGTPITLPSGTY